MTFDEFVGAELGALARFSGALAGDRHLAEDMLSDALLKVARRWRRISTMDDPAAYVIRGYCGAVRASLTDDGPPPLAAAGLTLH